jgi:predicted  nucleic acid-binding Zn-ribbon protein
VTKPSIKDEISKLVQLQNIDVKIFALSKEKIECPKILDAIVSEFESKKMMLKSLEDSKQKSILKQKDKEGELAGKEEAVKKAQGQMSLLKTNKEYQAKLTEIEGFKADMSLIEEDILKLMDVIDAAKKEIESEKNNLVNEEKKFNEKKNIYNNRIKEIDGQIVDLTGKRKILTDSVDKMILKQYEHILHGKDGLALVKVKDNSCFGCHMTVPHQVVNEIKMYDRLITCGICARILYLEEDVNL